MVIINRGRYMETIHIRRLKPYFTENWYYKFVISNTIFHGGEWHGHKRDANYNLEPKINHNFTNSLFRNTTS
jgi:hypothetical protein